jgi:hypothetical protein
MIVLNILNSSCNLEYIEVLGMNVPSMPFPVENTQNNTVSSA